MECSVTLPADFDSAKCASCGVMLVSDVDRVVAVFYSNEETMILKLCALCSVLVDQPSGTEVRSDLRNTLTLAATCGRA